ncbi:MAG TPA: carboxypeptidase regulatory-like domain-containing protein [Planctomycetota bacterium]|nr:carboxypeptidase regulatory-like domain-containing protein [Planctomycetota bacterium]
MRGLAAVLPLLAVLLGATLLVLRNPSRASEGPGKAAAVSVENMAAAAAATASSIFRGSAPTTTSAVRFVVLLRGRPAESGISVQRSGTGDFMKIRTEADGTQYLHDMPSGEYGIGIEREDAIPYSTVLVLAPGQTATVTVELKGGSRVSGTITDRSGRPLSGAQVLLLDEETKVSTDGRSVFSDEHGQYALRGVAPGDYGIRFRHPLYKPLDRMGLVLQRCGDEARIDAVLEVGARISGRVTDDSGAPIAGAELIAGNDDSAGTSKSAEDGTFTVTGLTDAPANLAASRAGYGRVVKRNLSGNPGDVVFVLPRAGTVLGRLAIDMVPAQTQITLSRFDEELRQVIPADSRFFCLPTTATFAFVDVPPGTYWLEVRVDGYEQVDRPQFVVNSGELTRETTVAMRRKN